MFANEVREGALLKALEFSTRTMPELFMEMPTRGGPDSAGLFHRWRVGAGNLAGGVEGDVDL